MLLYSRKTTFFLEFRSVIIPIDMLDLKPRGGDVFLLSSAVVVEREASVSPVSSCSCQERIVEQ